MRKKKQKDTEVSELKNMAPNVVVNDGQKEKKSRHIFAKLMCLIAASCVWMYVMNMETTDFERVFTQVPVVIDGVTQLNADSDMSVISGYDNTVDVIVLGKKSEVQAMTVEQIRVSVDVSALTEAGKFNLPVYVQVPDAFKVVNEDQLVAEVYVDVNTTREIPVRIAKLNYVASLAYTMGDPVLSLDTVTVTGPQQVLELIDCAALSFDLGTVTTSTTMVGTPRLVDAEGVPLSNPYVRSNITEITVNIPVKTTKVIKLTANCALPELANRWLAEFTPATVTVEGDPLLVESLEQVSVYDITTGTKAGEYVIGAGAIELPAGVTLQDSLDSFTVRIYQIVG